MKFFTNYVQRTNGKHSIKLRARGKYIFVLYSGVCLIDFYVYWEIKVLVFMRCTRYVRNRHSFTRIASFSELLTT
jgi:hypothetical protein